ncbi:MAG: trans-AT polyketide synthase, acyltransferase and oxidoreductase domain [Micromonosporaceae bacterium]|nr:trans-AT polyketide synthase, acyltransferase and oxidoreductase domain [Micromonosporaceae bacterium]
MLAPDPATRRDDGLVRPDALGSAEFRADHRVRYAYVAGAMYKAIASVDLVIRMGQAGLLAYYGSGGVRPDDIAGAIDDIQRVLGRDGVYGMNLLASLDQPRREEQTVELFLRRGVRRIEASAFVQPSRGLVRYRLTGVRRGRDGLVSVPNLVLGKTSRPEVASTFLSPPPRHLVDALRAAGHLTEEEAALAGEVAMADDVCVEADSGGHTDQRQMVTLLPDMVRLRDRLAATVPGHQRTIRIGVAGGLGAPEGVAAAFILGADFVLTGSINQCTVEAGTSPAVKDLLELAGVQDTAMVPAGDMLEIGARAQVLRKGLFFPARANKLYDLYRRHDSLDDLDPATRAQLEKFFRQPLADVWAQTSEYLAAHDPAALEHAGRDPKHKMALIFKWYFVQATRYAMSGDADLRTDYQIACGPAMGALNTILEGTARQHWRHRHVDDLAEFLMTGAAAVLTDRLARLAGARAASPLPSTPPPAVPTPSAAPVQPVPPAPLAASRAN